MSSRPQTVDNHPSLLWIAIPTILLVSGYLARRWYLARRLQVDGIGKGAPGFQTNVRQVRVPPEIATRIQRGEEVSAEEITAAISQTENAAASSTPTEPPKENTATTSESVNEWLPKSITSSKKRKRPGRRA